MAWLTPIRVRASTAGDDDASPGASRAWSCRRRCRSRRSGLAADAGTGGDGLRVAGRRRRSSSAGLGRRRVPYSRQEGLLERRLAADEVDQLVAGRRADDRRDRARDAQAQDVVLGRRRRSRRAAPRTRPPARRPAKRSSTWWWARSRSASIRSTLTRRPSRMIATRSQVFSTSDRMWLDRKTVRPSAFGLADDLVERLLDERVEARGRLVEDQQVRPVLERDDRARSSACCPSSTP